VAVPGIVAFRNARIGLTSNPPPHGGLVFFYWADMKPNPKPPVIGNERAFTYMTTARIEEDDLDVPLTVFIFDNRIKPENKGMRSDNNGFWPSLQHEISHYAGVKHPKNYQLQNCGKRRYDKEKEEEKKDKGRNGNRGGGGLGGQLGNNPVPPPIKPWDDWWCDTFGWRCPEEDPPKVPEVILGEGRGACYSTCPGAPKPPDDSWPMCEDEKCGGDDDGG